MAVWLFKSHYAGTTEQNNKKVFGSLQEVPIHSSTQVTLNRTELDQVEDSQIEGAALHGLQTSQSSQVRTGSEYDLHCHSTSTVPMSWTLTCYATANNFVVSKSW